MRKTLALILSICLAAGSLSGCAGGGSAEKPAEKPESAKTTDSAGSSAAETSTEAEAKTEAQNQVSDVEWPEFLTVGGGSTGGIFFSAAAGIAQLISDKTDSTATAQTTTGGGQNVQLMKAGEMEMGIADATVCYEAFNGEGDFDTPISNIRAIGVLYNSYYQEVISTSSKAKDMTELAGCTVVVGGAGSGTENSARKVLAAHGYDYVDKKDVKPEFVGISEGSELIQNKQADAMNCISSFPFSSFVELTMTDTVKLVSLEDQAIKSLTGTYPQFLEGIIPKGTYQNQDEDVKTIYQGTFLICKEEMDEELVYQITKMMFENKDYLVNQHNCFNELNLETATDGMTIPLHPGAERYYREMGVIK